MNLSPNARWLLGGLAAVIVSLAAYDPIGLPQWAQGVVGLLAVLCVALGLDRPQIGGTQQGLAGPTKPQPPAADVDPEGGKP